MIRAVARDARGLPTRAAGVKPARAGARAELPLFSELSGCGRKDLPRVRSAQEGVYS